MVFAHPKSVKTDVVGVFDLFDELPEAPRRTQGAAALVERGGEAVDADLHRLSGARGSGWARRLFDPHGLFGHNRLSIYYLYDS